MRKAIFPLIVLAAALALSGCLRKSIDNSPPARRPVAEEGAGPDEKPGIISETYTVGEERRPAIEETHRVGEDGPEIIDESTDVQAAGDDGPVEVKAVVEETDRPDIGGDDLAEEATAPAQPAAEKAETAPVDPQARAAFEHAPDPAPLAEPEPATDPENETVPTGEALELKAPAAPAAAAAAALETGPYFVQVGAFSDLENANKVLAGLLSDGYKGSMLEKTDTGMYRVHAGAFADEAGADAALDALKADFPKGFVIKLP